LTRFSSSYTVSDVKSVASSVVATPRGLISFVWSPTSSYSKRVVR
jgi:hypothetical protein